jgi:hypothetical protein
MGEHRWKIIAEYKDGLSKPLCEVIDRVELLGHTLAVCEKEFNYLSKLNEFDARRFRFDQIAGRARSGRREVQSLQTMAKGARISASSSAVRYFRASGCRRLLMIRAMCSSRLLKEWRT